MATPTYPLADVQAQCYKTMPAIKNSSAGAMQDVYHWRCPSGQMAYVKVSLDPASKVVISLKEK